MLNLLTINGTSSFPTDPNNYPSMVALALTPSPWQAVADKIDGIATSPLINWLPLNYPMATYPMGASVATGITNAIAVLNANPGPFAVAAYSQGSIVWSTLWRDHILSPTGDLHDRLDDVVAAVNWGNPMRAPGVSNGNAYAGWAMPAEQYGVQTGGIAGTNDLTVAQTPSWWLDFVNPNDLYTDCPVGTQAGTDEMLIYNIVMSMAAPSVGAVIALLESAVVQLSSPIAELIGVIEAIVNGLTFVAAGPSAGHYTYSVDPAIAYLTEVAQQYA